MKISVFIWLSFALLATSLSARESAPGYTQSYVILIKGAAAGRESVTETRSETGDLLVASEHEIFITDGLETKRMAFSTKMVLSKSTRIPVSYSYRYTSGNSGDSFDVVVKDGQITRTLNRAGRSSEASVPFKPDMVILDFNVYCQYDNLIPRYDMKKGGRQLFADFVPVIGNDIPLALTYMGEEKLTLSTGSLPIRNFRVEFVGIWNGTVSADKKGRLVRLVVPAQDLEVVRQDLLVSDDPKN